MRFLVERSPAGGWHVKLELDVDLRTDRPDELASVLRGAAAGDVAPR